jgi:hypothetical protein
MPPDAHDPTPGPPDTRREADDALLADLTAPPALEEARDAYRYWARRKGDLPVYKRAERKEAEQMTARWKQRLAAAERERYGPGPLEQLANAIGVRWQPSRLPSRRKVVAGLSALAIVVLVVLVLLLVALVVLWPDIAPIVRTLLNSDGGRGG